MSDNSITVFKNGVSQKITENFSSGEFDCKCGSVNCKTTQLKISHVERLQKFHEFVTTRVKEIQEDFSHVSMVVTSGYRCAKWNDEVGGASQSRHRVSDASDLKVYCIVTKGKNKRIQIHPDIVHELAEEFGFDGIGKYSNFTHVDSRGHKARW